MRDWVGSVHESFYVLGSVLGPYPYPEMIREFHSCIGIEARRQILDRESKLPREVIACVGGGSNAIGMFSGFIDDKSVKLIGVEAGGEGVETGKHASRFNGGSLGIFHGCKTYLLQDDDGQTMDTHSISAGLDYPRSVLNTPIYVILGELNIVTPPTKKLKKHSIKSRN